MRPLRVVPDGAGLFRRAPRADEPSRAGRRRAAACVQAAAVGTAAVVLLCRVTTVHAWNSVYAEDYGIFLPQSLAHPWRLLVPYDGYLQFVPRLLGQAIALLPLTWAAPAFAGAGALIAAGCALFTYHASAGYIRSRTLRAVLAAAVILLPVAPLELADNGVNTPWYLVIALFWAVLWRPDSLAGKAVSALIAFAAVASSPTALVFAPLLALRLLALRTVRENAVTAGWLLGWPLQLYAIALSYASHSPRVSSLAPLGAAVEYWARTVVLRAFGWHVSWALVRALGTSGATLLCGAVLSVLLGLAWLASAPPARVLIPLCVVTGFVFTVGAAAVAVVVVHQAPVLSPVSFEPASRYSAMPLVLLDAALIAGVDAFASRYGGLEEASRAAAHGVIPAILRGRLDALVRGPAARPAAVMAVFAALLCVLGPGWVTDYRYPTQRTTNGPWAPVAARYLNYCQDHQTIALPVWSGHRTLIHVPVPCSRLVR